MGQILRLTSRLGGLDVRGRYLLCNDYPASPVFIMCILTHTLCSAMSLRLGQLASMAGIDQSDFGPPQLSSSVGQPLVGAGDQDTGDKVDAAPSVNSLSAVWVVYSMYVLRLSSGMVFLW